MGGGRLAFAATAMVLGAACSGDQAAPADTGSPISAAPSTAVTESSDASPLPRDVTEARPIIAGDGSFPTPVRKQQLQSPPLPGAVDIGSGRIWVPWPPYPEALAAAEAAAAPVAEPAARGSRSALSDDVAAGLRYVVDQRREWEAMPPYLADARDALEQGEGIARRRAGTETAWELVIDPSGLDYQTRLSADRSAAYDHAALCPPHPTPQALGIDVGDSAQQRDRAAAAVEAFILGMRSPGDRPMHSWGTTVNDVAKLLVYSPGEPMELALGGHSLTDMGFFPGDWSAQAKRWLTLRAAHGAVTDSLVGHAAVSTGPASLWEACSDLATIIPGVYTASHRTRQLESLWARGLRLEFAFPPVERAWVGDLSAAGQALAVICHPPGQSFLVDASSGERLDAGTDHPAQVEAMWLTWSRLSFRVLRNELFEGGCDGDAFERARQWLADAQQADAASVDWSEPRVWASGVRNRWVAVREWVDVPQREAWTAHRDHRWHLEWWCQAGIPVGTLVDGELHRPELEPHCTSAQWRALAAAAPAVTSELSATAWDPGASWHERMYLSPFKSFEVVFGCSGDPSVIDEALARPVERRAKKPWPPGSLPLTESERAYPRPMPPCPEAGWPPQTDRYWWPAAASLSEAQLPSAGGSS
ncbi:hypothetical protein [Candidatus Poriferisodalis sp.]|uniref:hypothetical protein n=1 Tax=Candidatus Poriferisodalis sp. TaxID=3101277 RepID=UPI003B01B036